MTPRRADHHQQLETQLLVRSSRDQLIQRGILRPSGVGLVGWLALDDHDNDAIRNPKPFAWTFSQRNLKHHELWTQCHAKNFSMYLTVAGTAFIQGEFTDQSFEQLSLRDQDCSTRNWSMQCVSLSKKHASRFAQDLHKTQAPASSSKPTTSTSTSASWCPRALPLKARIRFLACGVAHCCALSETNELFSVGVGVNGQLGLGSKVTQATKFTSVACSSPVLAGMLQKEPVATLRLRCGPFTSAMLFAKGQDSCLWLFGLLPQPQKDPNDISYFTTQWTPALSDIAWQVVQSVTGGLVDVGLGLHHVVLLTGDHNVFTWGFGTHGELGLGPEILVSAESARLVEFTYRSDKMYHDAKAKLTPTPTLQVLAIAVGFNHTLVQTTMGLFAWGSNRFGECGIRTGFQEYFLPSRVALDPQQEADERRHPKETAICAHWHTSSAFDHVEGRVFVWGLCSDCTAVTLPIEVKELVGQRKVSCAAAPGFVCCGVEEATCCRVCAPIDQEDIVVDQLSCRSALGHGLTTTDKFPKWTASVGTSIPIALSLLLPGSSHAKLPPPHRVLVELSSWWATEGRAAKKKHRKNKKSRQLICRVDCDRIQRRRRRRVTLPEEEAQVESHSRAFVTDIQSLSPGEVLVNVTISGSHVIGSPFKLHIDAPSECRANSNPLHNPAIGSSILRLQIVAVSSSSTTTSSSSNGSSRLCFEQLQWAFPLVHRHVRVLTGSAIFALVEMSCEQDIVPDTYADFKGLELYFESLMECGHSTLVAPRFTPTDKHVRYAIARLVLTKPGKYAVGIRKIKQPACVGTGSLTAFGGQEKTLGPAVSVSCVVDTPQRMRFLVNNKSMLQQVFLAACAHTHATTASCYQAQSTQDVSSHAIWSSLLLHQSAPVRDQVIETPLAMACEEELDFDCIAFEAEQWRRRDGSARSQEAFTKRPMANGVTWSQLETFVGQMLPPESPQRSDATPSDGLLVDLLRQLAFPDSWTRGDVVNELASTRTAIGRRGSSKQIKLAKLHGVVSSLSQPQLCVDQKLQELLVSSQSVSDLDAHQQQLEEQTADHRMLTEPREARDGSPVTKYRSLDATSPSSANLQFYIEGRVDDHGECFYLAFHSLTDRLIGDQELAELGAALADQSGWCTSPTRRSPGCCALRQFLLHEMKRKQWTLRDLFESFRHSGCYRPGPRNTADTSAREKTHHGVEACSTTSHANAMIKQFFDLTAFQRVLRASWPEFATQFSKEEVFEMFSAVNQDNDSKVSYSELRVFLADPSFSSFWTAYVTSGIPDAFTLAELATRFQEFDERTAGPRALWLSWEHFVPILLAFHTRHSPQSCSPAQICRLLTRFDCNGVGVIHVELFLQEIQRVLQRQQDNTPFYHFGSGVKPPPNAFMDYSTPQAMSKLLERRAEQTRAKGSPSDKVRAIQSACQSGNTTLAKVRNLPLSYVISQSVVFRPKRYRGQLSTDDTPLDAAEQSV